MRQSMVRLSSFTLIELLVVITLVGILLSVLLPAIGAAREVALTMSAAV